MWNVPKIWNGADVWILGGGPSLTETFKIPEVIVNGVRARKLPLSSYSPYMKAIHDKRVIGINVAYQLGDWVDLMFFGDNGFYLKYGSELTEFNGIVASCAPNASNEKWLKFVQRDGSQKNYISLEPTKVRWNETSGAAAINLAVHLGAKRIILVAFDMNLTNNQQHWHNVYNKSTLTEKEVKQKEARMQELHLSPFKGIKKALDSLGIEIYNVSPNSAITCIEKKTLEELL